VPNSNSIASLLIGAALSVGVAVVAAAAGPQAASSPAPGDGKAAASTSRESDFVTRVRRLTYEGRRAGEGYFSPDGAKLVFQSEREPGNPFYQIYLLDLASGETRRISPGMGKTTCSFVRPGTGEVLFASTHHDPRSLDLQREELELRGSGRERRYAWDYDPEMELYSASANTLELRRLTDVRGYDAEASFSPDGKWIAFSSTRSGYEDAGPGTVPDPERAKQLETDPAYFGEIYIMPAEGGEAKRLTTVPGYDGGPFFFGDGSRILWRRFTENGLIADVWSMKPDGSDQRRLTDFGAMSWAPWPDPGGRYILFASNKLGFSNFEIYLVDVEGTKEPVRVTYSDGFDGLPVLSPDGRTLAWTSTRHGEAGGQIFVGQWNDAAALAAIEKAPPRVGTATEP
jgi:Tol biopolymer transport system component